MNELFERLKEDVLIVNKSGVIQYCNEKMGFKLQYCSKSMKGWGIEKILDGVNQREDVIKSLVKGGEKSIYLQTKKKESVIYQFKVVEELLDECVVYILLGQVKEAQEDTGPSMRSILDQLPYEINVKGLDEKYIYVNETACKNNELTKSQVIGHTDTEIFGQQAGEVTEKEDRRILKSLMPKKIEAWRDYAEHKFVKIHKIPFYYEGKVAGLLKVGKNYTLDKMIDEKMDETYREMMNLGNSEDRKERVVTDDLQEISIQECLLRELRAQGINVLAYDETKDQLISRFYAGICQEIVHKEGLECVPAELTRKILEMEDYRGVYPVEEGVLNTRRDVFLSRGIKYAGTYPIYYGQEFMGVIVILYKDHKAVTALIQSLIEKVCMQLANILKQFQLVSKLKKELERRRMVEEEIEYLLDTAADVMKILDEEGNICRVNSSFCELVGQSKEELIGKRDKEVEGIKYYLDKDQQEVWIEWQVKYVPEKRVYVWMGTDVTKDRLIEKQKVHYEKKKQKEMIKNEFFVKMSHEFKTPLNIILSTRQLLEAAAYEKEQKDLAKHMKNNTYGLLKLVNNLIDLTEIDTGFSQLQLGSHNIVEVIENVTDSIIPYIREKEISLIFDTEVEELIVICDRGKIERVILGLISEAIRHIKHDGVLNVEIKQGPDKVIVSVTDNGLVVGRSDIQSMFERCEKGQIGNVELFIINAFVNMHQGKIEVTSRSEVGTTISFELPRKDIREDKQYTESRVEMLGERYKVEFGDVG